MNPINEQLKKFAEELNHAAEREVIRISIALSEQLSLTDSKFGGLPYIPTGGSIPTTPEGDLLFMLAQINCEQLPENSIYPKKGLLQFWIAQNIYEDYYDFSHVVYHPTFSEGMQEKDIREIYVKTAPFPLNRIISLLCPLQKLKKVFPQLIIFLMKYMQINGKKIFLMIKLWIILNCQIISTRKC